MLNPDIARQLNVNEDNLLQVKNIIFDLGGVIINIHYQASIELFKQMGFTDFEGIYTQLKQTHLFDLLETGKIAPQIFRDELRKYNLSISDEQIDQAWNAMIGSMPAEHIPLLMRIRKKYRTFLLSNTNAIHINYFQNYLKQSFGANPLPLMFEHTYYSHDIGERKPNVSAYEFVLNDAGLKASETLFIDDLAANIEGARKAGLLAYHLSDETISDIFQN
ncbi:MAG: HAD family phosphatase [Bacteroidota bacterium]|nr:HAD family phosphatase [Bacteroidota bacterium]